MSIEPTAAAPGCPEQLFEERIYRLEEELDAIMRLARDPEQHRLLVQQRHGIGAIQLRAQWLVSSLNGDGPEVEEAISRTMSAIGALRKPKLRLAHA